MSTGQDIRLRDVKNPNVINGTTKPEVTNGRDAYDEKGPEDEGRCSKLHDQCVTCCIPCSASHHPLPENPSTFQRFKHAFMLPPRGNLAFYIQFVVVMVQIWVVVYSLTHTQALPGGNFFSLLMLFVCCAIGGYLVSFVNLPPLLGMLILGLLLRNLPGVKSVGENIDSKWSGALRKIALTVILTRAGLGLDIVKLKKLSLAVLRLALLPCTAEILTVGILSKFLLGFPWVWSLMMGCILGALSPAVTVPSLVSLQDRRYGIAKGIPTMLLAAGGLDNVLCVTGFSVFMGIIFSDGDMAVTIIKGPIGVIVGIIYGFIAGFFLWYFPSKDCPNPVFYRTLMLICAGLIAVFGSSEVGLSGAGPLGCLTTATVAAYKWRQRRRPGETDETAGVMALVWLIMQHFLFGLIGTAVNVSNIQSSTAGLGIGTLAIGLVVRSIVSFTVTMGTGFNIKERVFVTLTWLSKATVQAAIGGLALDKVMESADPNMDHKKYATDILTISVLAIIICAPTGATLMGILGPKFLVKGEEEDIEVQVKADERSVSVSEDLEVKDVVEIVQERGSLRSSRSSLENEIFKSELSLVLENRRKSETNNSGIENLAFTPDITPSDNNVTSGNCKDVSNDVSKIEVDDTGDNSKNQSEPNADIVVEAVNNDKDSENDTVVAVENVEIQKEEGKYKTVVDVTGNTGSETGSRTSS